MNRRMRETDKQPRHVRSSKHDAISNGNPRLPPNSGPSIKSLLDISGFRGS